MSCVFVLLLPLCSAKRLLVTAEKSGALKVYSYPCITPNVGVLAASPPPSPPPLGVLDITV